MTKLSLLSGGSSPRERRNVAVLVLAQAFLGAQMSIIFTVGGLAGQMLAPNPCVATLPLSMIVLATTLSAQPLARFMGRRGRRAGFILGSGMGALGAGVAALALWLHSYPLFMAGSFLTGIYMAGQGFYRFAATDGASPAFQPRAIAWVMGGGLLAALIGRPILDATAMALPTHFTGAYLAIVCLNLLGPLLFAFLDLPKPGPRAAAGDEGRTKRELLRDPTILVAMICAMVSYALMNLVMTSTPLAMVGHGFTPSHAAGVVQAHVLAMYLPSFFTGAVIARLGAARVSALGLALLALAGGAALTGVELGNFYVALILLGVGWNFGFIGATAMLTRAQRPGEATRVQGMNDAVVFAGVFLASLSSGGLMNCSGAVDTVAGWNAVNMAMLPFLALAGGALIWLALRPKARG